MKTISRFFFKAWRPAILVISLGLIAYFLYFHNLQGFLPGYAAPERQAHQTAATWQAIWDNPLNAPFKLGVLGLGLAGHHHLLTTRVVAAASGIIAVITFFFIARAWYGFRVGFLGAVLFATSTGFLHAARLGTPQILQMGVLLLIGTLLWHRRAPRLRPWLTYLVVAAFGVLLYVPGMVWFELIIGCIVYKQIFRHWSRSAIVHRIIWAVLGLSLAAPLIGAILIHPHLLLPTLGLPSSLHSLSHIPSSLVHTILSIGVRSDGNGLIWLGHTPLLNVIELILVAIGLYYYVYLQRSLRSILLASTLAVGIVLTSLGGGVVIACIVPILYLLATSGLSHFLDEWLSVFPRNPIARSFGVLVLCIMLGFSVLYHVRSYFVAWPHNSVTKQTFNLPPE
jgi:hypothetical protein